MVLVVVALLLVVVTLVLPGSDKKRCRHGWVGWRGDKISHDAWGRCGIIAYRPGLVPWRRKLCAQHKPRHNVQRLPRHKLHASFFFFFFFNLEGLPTPGGTGRSAAARTRGAAASGPSPPRSPQGAPPEPAPSPPFARDAHDGPHTHAFAKNNNKKIKKQKNVMWRRAPAGAASYPRRKGNARALLYSCHSARGTNTRTASNTPVLRTCCRVG